MKWLWNKIEEKDWNKQKKSCCYIWCQIIFWTVLPTLLCLLAGGISGYNTQWIRESLLIIGYSGMGIGFFGSVLYCMIK